MEKGDIVTQLIGGIMPNSLTVTHIEPFSGIIHCDDVKFCPTTGMELDEDKEWGPEHEKTGSYLKEVLDERAQDRREMQAQIRAEAEAEAEESAHGGESA